MPSFIGFRLFLLPEVRFTTKKMPDLLLVVKQVTDLRNLIIFVSWLTSINQKLFTKT